MYAFTHSPCDLNAPALMLMSCITSQLSVLLTLIIAAYIYTCTVLVQFLHFLHSIILLQLVASCPDFPFGACDPIEQISQVCDALIFSANCLSSRLPYGISGPYSRSGTGLFSVLLCMSVVWSSVSHNFSSISIQHISVMKD